MRKVRILIISPPALGQVISQLFRGLPQFDIIGRISTHRRLAEEAGRLLPELIVASVKPVKTAVCAAVLAIKHSSPRSKLILICPVPDLILSARRCGADACLEEEKVVLRLLRVAAALSAQTA
jgi:hypothetical protein